MLLRTASFDLLRRRRGRGGALVALLDAGSAGLDAEVWWAFLRLTDPGYLGDDEGIARRTISTVITVLGYVLFLGLLIAILTQWLNALIEQLESGLTPVVFSNHVVVLGWNHRVPVIVSELLATGSRLERFLAKHGARELRIVIMAEHVDGELQRELRERLGGLWNDRQVLLRSGSPLRFDHLQRVAYQDASVLILPGADFAEQRPEAVDARTAKTLLAVSEHARRSGVAPPLAVAEFCDGRRAVVARQAYSGESEVLAADEIVSRLLAESVRQRGLCSVYSELLTLNQGNALHIRRIEGSAGSRFGELRGAFPRAILLGTVRPGEGSPTLDPDPQMLLEEEDLLVLVARSFDDCTPGAARPMGSREAGAALPLAAPPTAPAPLAAPGNRRVLLLGWSRKAPPLLESFERYAGNDFEVDVVSLKPLDVRENALARHGTALATCRVRQIQAGYSAPGVLERLEPQGYDNIILLASERLEEEGQADATTLFAYLMLCGLLRDDDTRPRIFVELLDQENEFLLQGKGEDVIVSPVLVSYLLSQVALRRELAAVFAELSRPGGAQIVLEPAADFLAASGPVGFEDLDRAAAARGEIALGLWRAEGPAAGLALNPDRDTRWALAPSDEVVVLRSCDEPEAGG